MFAKSQTPPKCHAKSTQKGKERTTRSQDTQEQQTNRTRLTRSIQTPALQTPKRDPAAQDQDHCSLYPPRVAHLRNETQASGQPCGQSSTDLTANRRCQCQRQLFFLALTLRPSPLTRAHRHTAGSAFARTQKKTGKAACPAPLSSPRPRCSRRDETRGDIFRTERNQSALLWPRHRCRHAQQQQRVKKRPAAKRGENPMRRRETKRLMDGRTGGGENLLPSKIHIGSFSCLPTTLLFLHSSLLLLFVQ